MKKIAVIGGGAAGMMAAIAAARAGVEVTILEKNERIGKKLLSTGNGKCNFSNREFSTDCYHTTDKSGLEEIFMQFSVEDTVAFFERAGMLVKDRNGYLYPLSEQASTVLDILRLELVRNKIQIEASTKVTAIQKEKKSGLFLVEANGEKKRFHSVIIACGGCAAPKTGSDGSGFDLAKNLGHHIISTVPALVQLRCREDFFKMVGGVRCEASLTLEADGRIQCTEQGELQFTDYGISGIPVFQLSRTAAYLVREKKVPCVYIDFFPGYSSDEYDALCEKRWANAEGMNLEDFLLGMANKKINMMLIKQAGLKQAEAVSQLSREKIKELFSSYRRLCVHVIDTNSYDNAQVTAGGVDRKEVSLQMESLYVPGLFFAGEVMDIDGRCGGYNLQWAWTSGYIAGKNAAQ